MFSLTSTRTAGKHLSRAKKHLAVLSITLLGAGGIAAAAAPAASAGIDGGVDMNAACAAQYGPGAYSTGDIGGNVYSWFCINRDGTNLGGIDVNAQCVRQYGPGAYALFSDYSNPYSWYCLS